jgi:hypothetical protein
MSNKILGLLQEGKELSELDMFTYGYGTSFRTRICELRKMGHKILDRYVKSPSGSRYKKYRMEKTDE